MTVCLFSFKTGYIFDKGRSALWALCIVCFLPDIMSLSDVGSVVIDPGSSLLRAGFSGDDAMRVLIPSVVGRPRLKLVGHVGILIINH